MSFQIMILENNDGIQPHFLQLHVTQKFRIYCTVKCKGLIPKRKGVQSSYKMLNFDCNFNEFVPS